MRTVILVAVGVVLLAAIGFLAWQGLSPPPPPVTEQPIQGLEPGRGRGLVLTHCDVCHSTALVVSFHASRARWDAVITRMQEEEGLWGLPPEDREAILDYLATTQGPEQGPGQGPGGAGELPGGPWAQPLYPPNPIW